MFRKIFVVLAFACTATLAFATKSHSRFGDVSHISNILPPGAQTITDVWGYVDPNTLNEYAVIGDRYRGFYVIDVTDPTSPSVALDFTGHGVPGFDVKVWNRFAFCCDGGIISSTSRVVNIRQLSNPTLSATFEAAHNFTIDETGYLYAERRGLRCYDIRYNAMDPKLLWNDGTGDGHDATIVGNLLYDFRAAFFLRIWDITSRDAPTLLSSMSDPSIVYYHSGAPTEDGNYIYMCDESPTVANPDIFIWDVSDYDNPRLAGSISDSTSTVHNLYIVGDLAFVAYYAAGFKVFDISDPEHPVLAGQYPTSVLTGEGFKGAFGVYPFAPSGNVYVSDMQNGLFVFSVAGLTTPVAFRAFDVHVRGGAVELVWQIVADEPIAGFNVYRGDSRGGDVRVNDVMLPADARSFTDDGVSPGQRYTYRIVAVASDGEVTQSQHVDVRVPSITGTLGQNRPNPMNTSTVIPFQLAEPGPIKLTIVDARGRTLRTLADGPHAAGPGEAVWDGKNASGQVVPSGIYFYKLSASGRTFTKRIALVR